MADLLLLYSRYSAYVHASFSKFATLFGYRVHVVKYPTDSNSPFSFGDQSNVFFYDRKEYGYEKLVKLVEENNIKVVLSTGWRDKDYLKLCKYVKQQKKGLTIGLIDNQWMGTGKQWLLTTVGSSYLRKVYSKLWVPGIFQYEYARRLGFRRFDIM